MKDEIPQVLERALIEPVEVTLETPDEASRWRYKVLNYIKRHAPEKKMLMVSLHGNQVRIRIPKIEVKTVE